MSWLMCIFSRLKRKSSHKSVDDILDFHRKIADQLSARSAEMSGKSERLAKEIAKVERQRQEAIVERRRADIASGQLGKMLRAIDSASVEA